MWDLKQETSLFIVILVFMSSWNFVLSRVEHEKSFITIGPDDTIQEAVISKEDTWLGKLFM